MATCVADKQYPECHVMDPCSCSCSCPVACVDAARWGSAINLSVDDVGVAYFQPALLLTKKDQRMNSSTRREILTGMVAATGLGLSGCGYVIYPERRHQTLTGTTLDPMIIVLDGLLILVGVLPGIIAFAIDVSSGCIYMPAGAQGQARGFRRFRTPGRRRHDFELALQEATGLPLALDDPRLQFVVEPMELSPSDLDAMHLTTTGTSPASDVRMVLGENGELLAFDVDC